MTLNDFIEVMRRNPDVTIHVQPMSDHSFSENVPVKVEAELAPGTNAVLFIKESLLPASLQTA